MHAACECVSGAYALSYIFSFNLCCAGYEKWLNIFRKKGAHEWSERNARAHTHTPNRLMLNEDEWRVNWTLKRTRNVEVTKMVDKYGWRFTFIRLYVLNVAPSDSQRSEFVACAFERKKKHFYDESEKRKQQRQQQQQRQPWMAPESNVSLEKKVISVQKRKSSFPDADRRCWTLGRCIPQTNEYLESIRAAVFRWIVFLSFFSSLIFGQNGIVTVWTSIIIFLWFAARCTRTHRLHVMQNEFREWIRCPSPQSFWCWIDAPRHHCVLQRFYFSFRVPDAATEISI